LLVRKVVSCGGCEESLPFGARLNEDAAFLLWQSIMDGATHNSTISEAFDGIGIVWDGNAMLEAATGMACCGS
jgi:hypothetical protein